jgi:hypothetical protein
MIMRMEQRAGSREQNYRRKRSTIGCLTLCALLFALSYSAGAQQTKKVTRIGYLSSIDPANESVRSEAIRRGLNELGYVEGQNIAIEYRYADGKPDRALSLRPNWCVSRLISS